MPLLLLLAYCAALVLLDLGVTLKRVLEYGTGVELNTLARNAMERWGALPGSIIGLLVPNAILLTLLAVFRLEKILIFLAGFRTCWALLSMYSILKLKNER